MSSQYPRPPTRRAPLGEATRRVNNSQLMQARALPSKGSPMPHYESLKADGLLQVINSPPVSPLSKGYSGDTASKPNIGYQRLSAISRDYPADNTNRLSQISAVSTNASDGRRLKQMIGPWQLGKTLGKGATARVRKARHISEDTTAAVKIIPKNNAQLSQAGSLVDLDRAEAQVVYTADGERRMPIGIEREVAIMKLMQHPNILKLYDIWENHKEIYLVLEYVDNGELFSHIMKTGRLEEEEAVKYFRQMLSAVGYCHSFNICHRDLKPENVLLMKDMTVKIADFGMAALHQSPNHKLKTACGSPHYAAPELIKGRLYRGEKADIWSLGVILYAMLAGQLPFDVDNHHSDWLPELLSLIKRGQYDMQPEFSKEATNLIWRILQTDPRNRIDIQQIWNHPLMRKYDYLDDYSTGKFPLYPNMKKHPALKREEIHERLLRPLRSMWHQLNENALIEALMSEEPNQQKLFYHLILEYTNNEMENYNPDVTYSASDYHHSRPLVLTKTYSTRNFLQPKSKGHRRQTSRFTVISNVPETEQSYDPFKASRPQQLESRAGDRPKVTIHRTQPSDEFTNSHSTSKVREESPASMLGVSSSQRSRQGKFVHPRAYASRSSIASSTRSRGSGSYVRVSTAHKRGVSFTHLRNQRVLSKHHSNHTEVTDNDGSTLRPVAELAPSTQYIRSRKAQSQLSDSMDVDANPARASNLWTEDVKELSHSLARDCDEAFNRLDDIAESPRRNSVPLPSFQKSELAKKPFLLEVPDNKLKRASLNNRPLPPVPSLSNPVKVTLREALKDAELRKLSADDSPGYLDRMVSHIDRLIQPTSSVTAATDRRSSSAPVDSKQTKSNAPLTSIYEAKIEGESPRQAESSHQIRPDTKSGRVASAPEPRKNMSYDRFTKPGSDIKTTIRVVHSDSPVRAPAPLTIRKKGAQNGPSALERRSRNADNFVGNDNKTYTVVEQRYQYQGDLNTGASSEVRSNEDQSSVSNSGTVLKKKSTWFKRTSKTENENDWRMSIGGANASQSSSNVNAVRAHGELPLQLPLKKKFSLGRLFKKRSSKSDIMALGNDSFEDRHDNESNSGSFEEARRASNGRRISSTSEAKARQIEPQRNWLAKLFNVKPAKKLMCFSVSKVRARQEVVRILKEWKRYGIRDVQADKARNIVFARVAAKNFLDMKEVAFAAEFMTVIEHGKRSHLCIARLTQERGAASSFHKVVETLDTVLKARGMLVNDDRKSKMMVKTLRSAD